MSEVPLYPPPRGLRDLRNPSSNTFMGVATRIKPCFFEPPQDALSLRSDVISSIKILSMTATEAVTSAAPVKGPDAGNTLIRVRGAGFLNHALLSCMFGLTVLPHTIFVGKSTPPQNRQLLISKIKQ